MKGLLIKDFIMLWRYCKSFLFLMVVFLIGSVFVTVNSFMTVYPIVLAGMFPFTICAYEEKCKWNVFCDALPISRTKVVASKYLFSLICIAAITLLVGISMAVKMVMAGGVDIKELISTLALLLAVAFASPGFMLPFVFKYSVEKARMAYYVTVGVVCGLAAITSMDVHIPHVPVYIALVAAIAFFVASCALSVKFYKEREL